MAARIARSVGAVVALLFLDYLLLAGIGYLLTKTLEKTSFIRWDSQVIRDFVGSRTTVMNDVTYWFSALGNTQAVIGALLIVAVGLKIAAKRWEPSLFLLTAVAGQALVFLVVQLTISRQRPQVKQLDHSPPTSSFPSGHTGAAVALFFASALLVLWLVRTSWLRILTAIVFVAVPFLVAYGRMYRGMHHPTDVMGAAINGIITVTVAAGVILGRGPLARLRPDGGVADPIEATLDDGGSHSLTAGHGGSRRAGSGVTPAAR